MTKEERKEFEKELIHERFDAMFDNTIGSLEKLTSKDGLDMILEERGNRYGEYKEQRYAVGQIVDAMHHVYILKHKEQATFSMLADWFYLAIKLARIPADVTYADNYDDLINYTKLIREIHVD